ncbi:MAG: membrane dipeptidase [Clostridia bacterium]|nr:membrane dipeptidase [Clostridia bacterium]
MIPLFDLHCDTLSELYLGNFSFSSAPLHISLDKCTGISPYRQVLAIWSDNSLSSEEAYERYKSTVSYAKKQGIDFVKDFKNIYKEKFILAVEDARLLNNDISRLDTLYSDGVKILTLCWRDTSCIGGGWNTDNALTPFGIDVVKRCFELGIIPDISHASLSVMHQVTQLARKYSKTIIASHSNSYTVCKHDRNLRDENFLQIMSLGGLVGISLCPQHLTEDGNADIHHILNHIEHYLSLNGEDSICLGCDFDGVSTLPNGIKNISDIPLLFNESVKKFGYRVSEKIFYENAYSFFKGIS